MPELIVLTGYPGSGKSTVAESYKEEGYEVVSSDSIRKMLYGSEEIQGNPKEVFHAAHTVAAMNLKEGKSVVFDSTALSPKERRNTLQSIEELAGGAEYEKVSLHIDTDIHVARVLNETRDRTVPGYVYGKMQARYREPSFEEGFDRLDTAHVFLDRELVDQMDLFTKEDLLHAIDKAEHLNAYGEKYFTIENGTDFATVLNSVNKELGEASDLALYLRQEDAKAILSFMEKAQECLPYEAYDKLEPVSSDVQKQLKNIAADVRETGPKEIYDEISR